MTRLKHEKGIMLRTLLLLRWRLAARSKRKRLAWLPELIRTYPSGTWIAVSVEAQSVVAHGKSHEAVIEAAKRRGESEPIITRVPDR